MYFSQEHNDFVGCKGRTYNFHCVKSIQIWSFFWSVFSPNTGKYRPEKTLYLNIFRAVLTYRIKPNEMFTEVVVMIKGCIHTLCHLFSRCYNLSFIIENVKELSCRDTSSEVLIQPFIILIGRQVGTQVYFAIKLFKNLETIKSIQLIQY